MIETIINAVVSFVSSLGYIGIFVMTFLEGTFVPIPSEITLIPAGYLIVKGEFNFWITLFFSIIGTIGGALLNYFIAYYFGRKIIIKYGKYFLLDDKKLKRIESFFEKHGPFSAFIGRIIPGVKHFISFPAGLARMNIKLFCLYSALGGGIWVTIILLLGVFIGDNADKIKHHIHILTIGIIVISIAFTILYSYFYHHKSKKYKKTPNRH